MKNEFYYYDDNTISVLLTRNQWVMINADDLSLITKYRWYALRPRKIFYAATNIKLSDGRKTILCMHRLLLGLNYGDPQEVDHIDGNGLDNRRNNIRIVSTAQNQHNQHVKQTGRHHDKPTSKFPGVCWYKARCLWAAKIRVSGKNIHLGYYDNEKEAAKTYLKAKSKRLAGMSSDELKALMRSQ